MMKNINKIHLFLMMFFAFTQIQSQQIWIIEEASVEFVSDAPLEIIKASSDRLQGAIDTEKRRFAFVINNNSFKGFNSALQQEHFYENYIETHKYPTSKFEGKIIEDYDFSENGEFEVRAKGVFDIHGVSRERIIKAYIKKEADVMQLQAEFLVPLEEHDINIPRIVYQKIAENIQVNVAARLKPKE